MYCAFLSTHMSHVDGSRLSQLKETNLTMVKLTTDMG